ncbi:MAG: hypothetical protein GY818_18080 [Planctomycetaceae bacterium]|nr:hypothetical protein [Planctomycetaceae bacterium]
MTTVRILSLSFLICFSFGVNPLSSSADEYVINSETSETHVVGDFACSTCPGPSKSALELIQDGGEVTAGEVWQFYHGQGIDSLEQLTLCLDVQHGDRTGTAGIRSLKLTIEDPESVELFLTDVSLGEHSLTIPNYEIAAFKPEAYLELELGYDFMKRFNADSQEKVSVKVSTEDGSQLSVMVIGQNNLFTANLDPISLGLFAIFWVLVFLALYNLTQPANKRPQAVSVLGSLPSSPQKVSPQ